MIDFETEVSKSRLNAIREFATGCERTTYEMADKLGLGLRVAREYVMHLDKCDALEVVRVERNQMFYVTTDRYDISRDTDFIEAFYSFRRGTNTAANVKPFRDWLQAAFFGEVTA